MDEIIGFAACYKSDKFDYKVRGANLRFAESGMLYVDSKHCSTL